MVNQVMVKAVVLVVVAVTQDLDWEAMP